jgi:3-oxoacyl-[acyl-carrier-protein] synthase II
MQNKVVITGTGLVSSLGLTVSETWESILANKQGIQTIDNFDATGIECPVAAQVNGLNESELGIHPRDARIMDKHAYMLMKSSRDAFIQSKLDSSPVPSEDTGFFAGMGMVDYNIEDLLPAVIGSLNSEGALDYDRFYSQAYQEIHPLWPLSMLNNISFCQVAIDLGIKGENTVFSPHSDSGMHAIIEGYNTLVDKRAKAVLAGGVSEKVCPLSIARTAEFGILNKSGESSGWCRPFAKDRKGTVLGEGCGVIAMELYSHAIGRQVPVQAIVSGYGTSFEKMQGANCPTAAAISSAMNNALAHADVKPSEIDAIIAHGEGTANGDRNEIDAIHNTFHKYSKDVTVFSSKSALGHMLAGSSPVDVILGIQMMNNGIIPATYGSDKPDDDIVFHIVRETPVKTRLMRILINSQSYEGQCASLILESADLVS